MPITPADLPGYVLRTLHTFGASYFASLALSPDGSTLYLSNGNAGTPAPPPGSGTNIVLAVDTTSFAVSTYATISGLGTAQVEECATDAAGNLYVLVSDSPHDGIARITPGAGSITYPWASVGTALAYNIIYGRDGKLYVAADHVYEIDPGSAAVTSIFAGSTATGIGSQALLPIAATSDGTVWLSRALTSGANSGVNNAITSIDPTRTTLTEYAIQTWEDPTDDLYPEIVGMWADAEDNLIIANLTRQGVIGGAPDLVWFLKFDTTSHVAYRIAGTWIYPQSRPGVVDGGLGTSLAASQFLGLQSWATAACMSQDGKTLWFLDDSNQDSRSTSADTLRTLAKGGGWSIGKLRVA